MTSSVAASSATRTGSCKGSNSTLVPIWTFFVRAAIAQPMASIEGE